MVRIYGVVSKLKVTFGLPDKMYRTLQKPIAVSNKHVSCIFFYVWLEQRVWCNNQHHQLWCWAWICNNTLALDIVLCLIREDWTISLWARISEAPGRSGGMGYKQQWWNKTHGVSSYVWKISTKYLLSPFFQVCTLSATRKFKKKWLQISKTKQ